MRNNSIMLSECVLIIAVFYCALMGQAPHLLFEIGHITLMVAGGHKLVL